MSRPNTHFNANRQKLVELSSELFLKNGYENTSVNDILKAAGISKGAMYHYFTSKEDILDAVVDYAMILQGEQINAIVSDPNLSALEKLEKLLFSDTKPREEIMPVVQLMQTGSKSLIYYITKEEAKKRSIPVFTSVIKQGIEEGVFETKYPDQASGFIYTAGQEMFFSARSKEEAKTNAKAFLEFLQRALNMKANAAEKLRETFYKVFL